VALLTRPSHQDQIEADALIKEARRLRRRRWFVGSVLALAAVLLAGGLYAATDSHRTALPPKIVTTSHGTRPYVNAKAFRRLGTLAFISKNRLWVLDGRARSVKEVDVPGSLSPMSPTLSPDGKWLAFLTNTGSDDSSVIQSLWIARGDGADAHEVENLLVNSSFGWSPTSDVLGVVTDAIPVASEGHVAFPHATAVELVTPDGTARPLLRLPSSQTASTPQIEDAVWSPTGDAVAVSTVAFANVGETVVRSYPVDGDAPTTWFSISNRARLPGICSGCGGQNTIADLAGWWSHWGIGFWVYSSGAIRDPDNTPLELLTSPGSTPRIIGETLSDGITDSIAAGAGGSLAIVSSTGGRSYGQGKNVEICARDSLTCSPIPQASVWNGPDDLSCPLPHCPLVPPPGSSGSGVSLDPEWSPTGSALAYVKSPDWMTPGWPALSWYGAHELFVWNAKTNASTQIADVSGVSVPTWSKDGESLLYVADDGLWLSSTSGRPVEIESPLFPEEEWRTIGSSSTLAYYGQVAWTGQFSWWS
jgi:WD40-like Beta Propeller Repeat